MNPTLSRASRRISSRNRELAVLALRCTFSLVRITSHYLDRSLALTYSGFVVTQYNARHPQQLHPRPIKKGGNLLFKLVSACL
jgi:hypothetical protein